MPPSIHIKRVYAEPSEDDGCRVLVDRLWPRGVSKDEGLFEAWLKDLAPSNELRKLFHAEELTFARFKTAYKKELASLESEQLDDVLDRLGRGKTVTLLYASKSEDQNHALVLAEFLKSKL